MPSNLQWRWRPAEWLSTSLETRPWTVQSFTRRPGCGFSILKGLSALVRWPKGSQASSHITSVLFAMLRQVTALSFTFCGIAGSSTWIAFS